MPDDLTTRKSLLHRLKTSPGDQDWDQFYQQYKSVILSFCLKRGLDEFAAHDVLQETMVLLIRKLPKFDYDPSQGRFRNWLLTLVDGKVGDAHRRAQRVRMISLHDERASNFAETAAATGAESSQTVESAWKQAMIEEALRRLKDDPKTKPQSLDVFRAYVMEDRPATEIARRYGLHHNAVYQIKNRLLRRLHAEVAAIEHSAPNLSPPG